MRPFLSVVVPVFNEEENLPVLLARLEEACRRQTEHYEIILCDDGSTDGTAAAIAASHRRDERIKLLGLSRNFGHHHAAQAGMDHATGDWLFCLDGDLQDPPELLDRLFRKAHEGYDVVNARKASRAEYGLRGLGFRAFHRLMGIASSEIRFEPNLGFFSLLRRDAYLRLRAMPERRKFLAGMRQWIGFRQAVLDFDRPARQSGATKQNLARLVTLALDALFAFSSRPIKVIWGLSIFGIAVSLAATAYTLYHHYYTHEALVGWSSIMSAILFMGSVQLCCVSILGEYLWRVYVEVQQRPYYVLRERLGLDEEALASPAPEREIARVGETWRGRRA